MRLKNYQSISFIKNTEYIDLTGDLELKATGND